MKKISKSPLMLTGFTSLLLLSFSSTGVEAQTAGPTPLVISNDPLPANIQQNLYTSPSAAPEITASQIKNSNYYDETTTLVGRKISGLKAEMFSLQGLISELSGRLASLEKQGQNMAAEYYANVATIRTQLQSGTTPGNPRLVKRLTSARQSLETLASNIAGLNNLSVEIANAASMTNFLLKSSRATYGLTGAIEEDHINLAKTEDSINGIVVAVDRLLSNVNDDITRTTAYLNTERENLQNNVFGYF